MSGRVGIGELGARFVDVKVADTAPAAHGPTNEWKQVRLGRHAIQEMLPMADIGFLKDAVLVRDAGPLWDEATHSPFLDALASGTLPGSA